MKKQQSKKDKKDESSEDIQEYQECECCKRKQLLDPQSNKQRFDQTITDLINQTNKNLPPNVSLDCVVTTNGIKLVFETKTNKNSPKIEHIHTQKLPTFETFAKYLLENPEILNDVFAYQDRVYQVDLDNYLFKDGKQIQETQWLLSELDQKNCFKEEYLPVMKYIDLDKFETGIQIDSKKQNTNDIQKQNGQDLQTQIETQEDKTNIDQEQRIKDYLKIHYNDTKIIKRIIAPGDNVEQYYSKNTKDWFKDNVIKLIKDKEAKGSIQIQENTIISSNSKDFNQQAAEFFSQIDGTGSTGTDGQSCEIQEVFNESSQFVMAMNERKNMTAEQSPGDMKCFQQNLTMMAFLKPNTIKCSTVISSNNLTVKTSISCQDSPKKKQKTKEIKFQQDCAILDALPFGFGQIDNFIKRRDCEGSFSWVSEYDKYMKEKQQQLKKQGQHVYYKFIMSIFDGGCGDIRSFRELKIFSQQRNKFNYSQINQQKEILPILVPECQISLREDSQPENQMYFVLQYLNRTKIGEISYNFIPQSLHTYLICQQFGKCSTDQNNNILGLKCFCKRNIVIFINLIQKKDQIADDRQDVNRALSQFLYRGYDIFLFNDITKKQKCKETFQTEQIFQINYQLKLMEIDLNNLKCTDDSNNLKILKYRIQAHKDLHNTRFLYFLMTQIHEKLFYAQQNNFNCFSLYDCKKLAILENYAMQILLVKQTGLLLMHEMIPANQIQNYDATIEFQRNHNEIDSNFAIYVLIQICLAQNLQQSASKYFQLLSKNEQIERQISEKSTTNHYRKCEAFSINIEKEKCKNLCFLNNNIKNIQSLSDLNIHSCQPKIDQQIWDETDKKLRWIGIEEIIQDNFIISDKKIEKNKQNEQINVIKHLLQYGDDPDSYKNQQDLKSLKKVVKQQVYGVKISLRVLSNTEWIQRKKIDNFDGMKIQPIVLMDEVYHEVKINNQNKNYWYFILRCMNLGEISEFWVNSNSQQNLELIDFIKEIEPQFFDKWQKNYRQTQVFDVLQRTPLQITIHKVKVNNQPCNIFNTQLATSYVLHHQAQKNYADNIFLEYQSKLQINEQQILMDYDKSNLNLQKCLKIYTQQQKQIQNNLKFYLQQNEKQKESLTLIYIEILTKLSQIYLGINIWSKSIKLANKALEIDEKQHYAVYLRSMAFLGKIYQQKKLKNDCKNLKCHICLKQADYVRNQFLNLIKQYSQEQMKLQSDLKQKQQKLFQNQKIELEFIQEVTKLQEKFESSQSQLAETIRAFQYTVNLIQKMRINITEQSIQKLHKISLQSEGSLLEQHSFFQKIDDSNISVLFDHRVKKANQRVIENFNNMGFEQQFENKIVQVYEKYKKNQKKLYTQEEQDLIIEKINQKLMIQQKQLKQIKEINQLKENNNQNQNQLNNQENMDLLFKFNRASANKELPQQQTIKDIPTQSKLIDYPISVPQTTPINQKSISQMSNQTLPIDKIVEQVSPSKTKNQKKKQKKKNKIKDQQKIPINQQSQKSSSNQSEINEIEDVEIKIIKKDIVNPPSLNNSSSQRNGKSVVVNNDNDDFFQSFQKVSKHAQKIKSKQVNQKAEEQKEAAQANTDQFIVLQNNYNGPNIGLELNSSLKDYMSEKAQRKLTKIETKFIQSKVSQWQDYEKYVKLGHLGFNRMQLSQINAMVIVDKCIEIGFDEQKYQVWISKRKDWDEFVAKNFEQKSKPKLRQDIDDDYRETQNQLNNLNQASKCRKCKADQIKKNLLYENENCKNDNQEDEEFFENHDPCCPNFINQNGMWNFHQTDGQKHQVRIKKLNAVKRNEVFDEKYEETREERELRLQEAERKRELIKLQEQKQLQNSDQKQKNQFSYGQAQNLISLSTNESEKVKTKKIKKEDLIQLENQNRELQIRRQRQLLIINGGKDPAQMKALQEALEKAELEKNGFCDENQKKLIQSKIAQKIHQQNINKYVYSSDEYVSGSSDESENEQVCQPKDQEERSTKSVQKPVTHNSIFAFTPYNHDSNSSNKDSDCNSKSKTANKIRTMQDLENHWKNNEKIIEKQKVESKESESMSQKEIKPSSLQDIYTKQKSVISIQSQTSSSGLVVQPQKISATNSNAKPPNYKTVLCKWFEQYGKCKFEGCTYAHGQKELMFSRRQNHESNISKNQQNDQVENQEDQNNYYDEEYYGEEYYNEVDEKDFRYKTSMCKHIQTHGTCPYITNCNFAHSKQELRKLPNYYVYPQY